MIKRLPKFDKKALKVLYLLGQVKRQNFLWRRFDQENHELSSPLSKAFSHQHNCYDMNDWQYHDTEILTKKRLLRSNPRRDATLWLSNSDEYFLSYLLCRGFAEQRSPIISHPHWYFDELLIQFDTSCSHLNCLVFCLSSSSPAHVSIFNLLDVNNHSLSQQSMLKDPIVARVKAKPSTDGPQLNSYCYIGESSLEDLKSTLSKISERCTVCRGTKQHVCLEKMCQGRALICLRCEQHEHQYHKLNELQMVLIDEKIVPSRSRVAETFLEDIANQLRVRLEHAQAIEQQANRLVTILVQTLNDIGRLANEVHETRDSSIESFRRTVHRGIELANEMKENHSLLQSRKELWKSLRDNFKASIQAVDFNDSVPRLPEQSLMVPVGHEIRKFDELIRSILKLSNNKTDSTNQQTSDWLKDKMALGQSFYNSDSTELLHSTHLSAYLRPNWHNQVAIESAHYRRQLIEYDGVLPMLEKFASRFLKFQKIESPQKIFTNPCYLNIPNAIRQLSICQNGPMNIQVSQQLLSLCLEGEGSYQLTFPPNSHYKLRKLKLLWTKDMINQLPTLAQLRQLQVILPKLSVSHIRPRQLIKFAIATNLMDLRVKACKQPKRGEQVNFKDLFASLRKRSLDLQKTFTRIQVLSLNSHLRDRERKETLLKFLDSAI